MAARATSRWLEPLKTCFIVNPRSGKASHALPAIREHVTRYRASLHLTERPRHASELSRSALEQGFERIVAVGGDGTMNEIASVLIDTPCTLALVPCGSGDGLGRHLGIHGTVAHALQLLQTGRVHRIDTGLANGHPFFTAAGMGFEAEIAQRFNRLERRGFVRYLTTSAWALHEWKPQDYQVTFRGQTERVQAFTLAVANANQYGNNARISPKARVDDGLLDLCVVPPVALYNALPLATRLFRGTLVHARDLKIWSGESFTVERAAPGPFHTDGEIHSGSTRIEFSVRPSSLRIMVPDTKAVG